MADQASEGLLSPFLRERRISAVKPFLTGKILDIGCGAGALASWVQPENYFGVDIDEDSLQTARLTYPLHFFSSAYPKQNEKFDTITALAVLEHVKAPLEFLVNVSHYLRQSPDAKIVCTTPHLLFGWSHTVGAKIGLFSRHANEEHETLFDKETLDAIALSAGLNLVLYKRFLFGVNQLAIFSRK
jgi:2-polyprenyl-3-methyl-5-hydroxy-6-metoxy-1,4-benzoquinol methylase